MKWRSVYFRVIYVLVTIASLVLASGAGSVARRALGTAVFGGMLGTAIVGILMIPVFYVFIQTITEKLRSKGKS